MIRCFHILLRRINEKIYLKALRKRNKNHSPSIICNNCIAGVIYHNLGLKFTSPTINLYIPGEDYLNFVRYIKEYQNAALIEIDSDKPFPVGQLCLNGYPKVSVFFQHYTNFNEAKKNGMSAISE